LAAKKELTKGYRLAWKQSPWAGHMHGQRLWPKEQLKQIRDICRGSNEKYPYIDTWYEWHDPEKTKCSGTDKDEDKHRPSVSLHK
jgi:hypothetical protein